MRAVPETVTVEVPAVTAYKYMMVNDRVVLATRPEWTKWWRNRPD